MTQELELLQRLELHSMEELVPQHPGQIRMRPVVVVVVVVQEMVVRVVQPQVPRLDRVVPALCRVVLVELEEPQLRAMATMQRN